jgi:hypothetical protein
MGQRINIQYSIDISELNTEVGRLLAIANRDLKALHSDRISEENTLSSDVVKDVDSLRKKLAAIDFTLRDVSNIVNSYIAYEAQLSMDDSMGQNVELQAQTNEVPT